MGSLCNIGRIFFGTAIAGMGILTIYYGDFPYMFIPPKHSWVPGIVISISGSVLVLTGACIVFQRKGGPISIVLGTVLLLIFCFYFVPYQLFASPNFRQFGDWENAAKELAFSGGAFVISGCFSAANENAFIRYLSKLPPFGPIIFAITIISFSMDHFLYANEAVDYVPAWIPYPLFWLYFTGAALLASGVAIISKIKIGLAAFLLGTMILTWFIILHIPRVIASPAIYLGSEITSALIALAYSGIALVISGTYSRNLRRL
jgi:hypothetical protein